MLAKVKKYKFYLFVLFIWSLSTAAKIKFNGFVFGFDYGIYQPDGKYYTYMALEFLNHNPVQSAQTVVDWYATHGFKMQHFTVNDLLPSTSPVYNLISHRILYPLLSVPFVALLGIPGMLVIPALSLLTLLFSIQKLSYIYNKPFVGLALVVMMTISPTVLRWMILNCTDSLLTGLFALVPIALIQSQKKHRGYMMFLLLLIVLTSATRFVLPLWIGIAFVIFVNKERIFALIITIVSFISALPALTAQASTALLPAEGDASLLSKVIMLPVSFVKVIVIDILEFAVLDRLLLILLVFALFQSIRSFKNLSSQYFLATFISAYFIGAVNGTLGVNFRYQMPILIFCAWTVVDQSRKRTPVIA